ncbi:hypothetical protein [Corynebacterium lowii]|uniref:FtsX-like permease family protein n=1 Tax=Corynebacterium lowii TaxID=1544413 RepID=A0A0Q0YKM0_9CORY|nr:hypothetical protein [Corynebacterium lowii]KQB87477.1 hypothetical protein Clow_00536 [Corynebacterium lowii]MDP9851929.1 hypothetical protein [Corynebacterium lowii]
MSHLLRVSTVILFLLSFLIAFPLAHLRDSDLGSATRQVFLIEESSGETSPQQFRDSLIEYAEEHHITIGLNYVEATSTDTNRHLYVAAGEDSSTMAQWLHSGYEGFDPKVEVTVSPLSEKELTDAGGDYHVAGSPEEYQALQRYVESMGFTVSPYDINWAYFLDHPIVITIIAMMFLIATLTLGGVLLRARDYAIRRIHGHGIWALIARDLRDLLPTALLSLFISVVLSGIALYFYNGLSLVGLYLQGVLALLLCGGIVLLVSLLMGIALLHLIALIPALSGKIPGLPTTIGAYALRLCALVVTLTAVGSVVSTAIEIQHQNNQEKAWRSHARAEIMRIANRIGEIDPHVAPALREADKNNELLMAEINLGNTGNPEYILANSLFAEQEVALPPQEAPTQGEALLVIPEGTSQELIESAREGIYWQAEYAEIPAPTIREKTIPGDTEVFTYATSFGHTAADSLVSGLPIAVLSRGLEGLADRNLVSGATQSNVLTTGAEATQKIIDDPQAGPFIGGHLTAFSQWEDSHTQARDHLRLQAINLVILILVVTAYVVGSAAVYQVRHRQRLTVTDLMGRSPWRARSSLLIVEALFLLVPLAWLVRRQYTYEQFSHYPIGQDVLRTMAVTPELIAAIIAISALWTITCLAMSAYFGRIYSRTPAH